MKNIKSEMKFRKSITVLVILVAIFASLASISGIFSKGGPGSFDYTSIRGEKVTLYGIGLYRHMSADVAIQGIAQDYVTLFIGVPLLLIAFFWAMNGSLKGRFMLAGVLNYLFVTYLFYMNMAMYNQLFLIYILLTGTTFFAFILSLLSIDIQKLPEQFSEKAPVKFSGIFLIVNAVIIALLWLSIIVPPLIDNTIYPDSVDHFTTLTVQGFDLSILLPISFLGGLLLLNRSRFGYLIATVTLIFLSILMTALVAKIIAMANAGVNVIPAIFIIPVINLISVICSLKMVKSLNAK